MPGQVVSKKARFVKEASNTLYNCSSKKKNALLNAIILQLRSQITAILEANKKDLKNAKITGLSEVMTERLTLNEKRIGQMVDGVKDIIKLRDPVGDVIGKIKRPNGLIIEKIRVPLGAVGIIYESRPNVTIDAAALCLKSGNAVLLRGGSEAIHTNKKLVGVIKKALQDVHLPLGCVEFIDTTNRSAVLEMLKQEKYLDASFRAEANS